MGTKSICKYSTGPQKTMESRLCERRTNSSLFPQEITSAAQQPVFFTRSAQLTHLAAEISFSMNGDNKMETEMVQFLMSNPQNLLSVVLCDPVDERALMVLPSCRQLDARRVSDSLTERSMYLMYAE